MQTRRDQYQAYKYLVRRVLSSMLGTEPEAPEQPMRRVGTASMISILIGGLICGIVGLVAWLVESTATSWIEKQSAVVREEESGAQFVYMLNQKTGEKELREVPNFVSAQLLLGNPEPEIASVGRDSLQGVPKGSPVGIEGAPSVLPSKEELASSPWAVCSRPHRASDSTDKKYQVEVLAGERIEGTYADDKAVVVQPHDSNQRYLLWHGKRLKANQVGLGAIELRRTPITVGAAWLNAIPKGQNLQGPVVPEAGSPASYTVDGQPVTIGEVFRNSSADDDYWLAYPDEPRPITVVQARLLLNNGARVDGGVQQTEATKVPSTALNEAAGGDPRSRQPGDLPEVLPEPLLARDAAEATLCATYTDPEGAEPPRIALVESDLPKPSQASAASAAGAAPEAVVADHTIVPAGKAAVVAMIRQIDTKPAGYFIVTDAGKKYAVESKEVLGMLGYGGVDTFHVPASVLKLIPSGPGLSRQEAGAVDSGKAGS